jgi:hypothetical protein
MLVEIETDCPNVTGLKWTLCTNHVSSVPWTPPVSVWIKIRYSHDNSPAAGMAADVDTQVDVLAMICNKAEIVSAVDVCIRR